MNKSIGEDSGESCSVCGRANTWHPDCPTCIYITKLEKALSFYADKGNWKKDHIAGNPFKWIGGNILADQGKTAQEVLKIIKK